MKKFDLIVFDLDGTLFDTANSIISSMQLASKKFGLKDLTEEDKKVFLGPPLDYSIKKVYNTNDEMTDNMIKEFRRVYFESEMYKTNLFDGINETLDYLKGNNYKIALCTYKHNYCLENLFNHFNIRKYFDSMCGGLGNEINKTDILKRVMNETGISNPEKILMIGDTEHDLKAAISIGCYFLGMTYGFGYQGLTDEEKNYKRIINYLDSAKYIIKEIEK